MNDAAAEHPNHFVKVTADWVNNVLRRRRPDSSHDYSLAHKVLQEMRNPVGGFRGRDDFRNYFWEIIGKNVSLKFERNERRNFTQFPGPMAAQLGKKDVSFLRQHGYWITEKSDGLRILFLATYVPGFPRWHFMLSNDKYTPLRLADSIRVEHEFEQFSQNPAAYSSPVSFALDNGETAALEFSPDLLRTNLTIAGTQHELHRALGATLAYVFDRTYDPYFVLDDFVLPRAAALEAAISNNDPPFTIPQLQMALLDGEYMYSHRRKRHVFSIFDIVGHLASNTECMNYYDVPLSQRCAAIRDIIVSPHDKFIQHYGFPFPESMLLVAKHFYCKADFDHLVQCIGKDTHGKYVYHGFDTNYTDGLVFTPEDTKLYCFKPGPAKRLLKWKWPDKLTADFKLIPRNTAASIQANRPGEYCMPPPTFTFQFQARYQKQSLEITYKDDQLLIPYGVDVPLDHPSIVECKFNQRVGKWEALTVRTDKTTPNGFTAISSTLEQIVQNLTIADLRKCLLEQCPTVLAPRRTVTLRENNDPHFKVEDANGKLALKYWVKPPGAMDMLWQTFTNVEDCVGMGFNTVADDGNIALEDHIRRHMASTNQALYVRARFSLELGRWELISGTGKLEMCSAVHVLHFLETMATTPPSELDPDRQAPQPASSEQTEPAAKRRKLPSRRTVAAPACGVETVPEPAPDVQEATQAVAQHYDEITAKSLDEHTGERSEMRLFNNWVKALLIQEYVSPLFSRPVVLDVCCGKGGDLGKWVKAKARLIVGADVSPKAIEAAQQRHGERFADVNAHFVCCDCFGSELSTRIGQVVAPLRPPAETGPFFDVVCCMFAMHYAFQTEQRARAFIQNVAAHLKPGGVFIGTTVDDRELISRIKTIPGKEGEPVMFGNAVYQVRFPRRPTVPISYGVPYEFALESSVDHCTEYLIPWSNFATMAQHHFNLVAEQEGNFRDFFKKHIVTKKGQFLWQTMVGTELATNVPANPLQKQEMWEAATVYRYFVFKKR
eukprot:TRINITY_DN24769_c0_g1_i1.p1 TRINITY_DN24769_c0_g1~~TRINITY_DN24769_c0_g1_i1.p1  ORF type:complete len:1005 (-),score=151.62 TRINITY_DN24769_c0_g1_i1:26-3040(-)